MEEIRSDVTAIPAKQIANSLRELILGGRRKMAQRLPTEEELSAQFGDAGADP